ncbi:Ras family, other [Cryptococcus neoformans C23]|nr:Ras family protein [Cryptococcus neoformans var. grubii H99]AUB22914.1 Ras family protein [Cryptococcus neoformans var. grubii]OWZ34773.1 Ras family, other [Cryptococcus neoformans var. grubii AD2-60a]OWZ46872.1 Ras family, other [Cryptococcus neoformans var. grubii C23]OWZ50662.1 Ras family, other [Cryptococcus neoformans var. grubii AD1-83a]OWZ56467.1 Ras family, other [Cryptococcus neoformans var. grubii 125.91]OXC86365.1 Ras family, other [Cryptococcus neoformans var. grubii AD1-7a]OX|eukprot:XP_012047256.1 Ras family protein [Cryptococcus neoformans var. grubii H99]
MLPSYSFFESDNMSSTSGPLKRKVVIMGSTSVGKTSLTQQYVAPPTYTASYYPTIEDTSHKIVKYKGADYDIEIVDSAGLEEYSLFPGKYAVGVHGYMLVYSIASRQSFDMVPTIYDKILDYAGLESVPLVIVGQKTDLRDERSVTKEEGEALAKKLRAGFIESSAKDNANVSGAFEVLLEEMQKVYNPQPEKKKSSWWPW